MDAPKEARAVESAVDRAVDDDLASPSASGGAESDHGSPRAHSFRQRRLTYTRHHILSDSAAAAVAELLAEDGEYVDEDLGLSAAAAGAAAEGVGRQDPDGADDGHGEEDASHNDDDGVGEPTKKRARTERTEPKKARTESASSTGSGTSSYLPSRVLHAGEIVRRHSDGSDRSDSASRKQHGPIDERRTGLHSHPSHPRHEGAVCKWKCRFSFCSTAPDHVLPFPRHVVGTYSHHGIEPVYDSDYDDEEESSDGENANSGGTVAKINQDRGGVAYPFANSDRTALFAVYDGHGGGGELVSQYALCEVQRRLEARVRSLGSGTNASPESVERDVAEAMRETFLQVDRGLLDEEEIEPMYAGTTANVLLVRDGVLYVANCGDSRAVLARSTKGGDGLSDAAGPSKKYENMTAVPLSVDQNPDSPGEEERILSSGGFVSPPPEPGLSSRVWLDPSHTQVGLAMARSIGDHAVKGVGVIAEPVVLSHRIDPRVDEFVIMATDGVWEFIDSDVAVGIVADRLGQGEGASGACEALIDAAVGRWHEVEGCYRDDITAIVIRLGDLWAERGGDRKGT